MREKNLPFFRWNVEDFLTDHKIKVVVQDGVLKEIHLEAEERKVDLEKEISVVWYRRVLSPNPSNEITDEEYKQFARWEGSVLLNNIWTILAHKVWLNTPFQNQVLSNKLYQLQLARKVGFDTPPTLVTNNPDEVRSFHKKYGIIIAKPISAGYITTNTQERRRLIYTHRLTKRDFQKLQSVKYSPVLFQQYINKKLELRITVVESSIFTCAIESQKSEKTKDDWRRYDFEKVPHYSYNLPSKVEAKLLRFMRLTGINFGAFDFILTPEDRYIFLEVNPNGQWYWIERLTSLPITRRLVDFFAKHIKTK